MNIFSKVEANPVQLMHCQCFYSVVMANSKLDYSGNFSQNVNGGTVLAQPTGKFLTLEPW